MSGFIKFILAATAFAPIFLIYAIVSFFNGNPWGSLISLGIALRLLGLCLLVLCCAKKCLGEMTFRPATVEPVDGESLGFILIYLLPLITNDLATDGLALLCAAVLLCVMVAASYNYHFNPLLSLLGYHFYKATVTRGVTHILITRQPIHKPDEDLRVVKLAQCVLIQKKSPC